MILSVLICAVPSRMERLSLPLFRKIEAQCDERTEVLLLLDNKRRTIGAKRNAILSVAKGRFVSFVDDDDDVSDDYVPSIVGAIESSDADCIVFDTLVNIDPAFEPRVVRSGVELENTQYTHDSGATRKPFHTMAYRREIAAQCAFSDCQYGEDAVWAEQAWPKVKNQARIDRVLYYYRWSEQVSEAK